MWALLAIGASFFWGMSYVLSEQVYKHISVLTTISITMLAGGLALFLTSFFMGTWTRDIQVISSNPKVLGLVVAAVVILIIAELLIGFSIVGKNATVAGLIEISYPLFIALFSYLIFREANFTAATAFGGALIFIGVGIIYAFNR